MKFYQQWEACIKDGSVKTDYFPAEVPGNVQKDYAIKTGILDDLQFGTNVMQLEKTENSTWEYRTYLSFDEAAGKEIYFVAEGIDYIFDILLDGSLIHTGEGMYTPVELNLTGKAHNGSLLQVVIHPHPKKKGSYVRDRSEAADSCKPPVCYGWDWNPRLLVSGIWMPAYIEVRGNGYIAHCEPKYSLDLDTRHANVTFEIDTKADYLLTVTDPDGKEVYNGKDKIFSLDNVKLWWCNGQGNPDLYRWSVKTAEDEKCGTIGFRTVTLVRNDGQQITAFPKGPYSSPITVKLNGRRIFAKGSNYVNDDIFPGNTKRETFEFLVTAAKDANMNIFRIWGGAGIVKPEFYELCDEVGIMVWQEFMLACNNYIGTEHYLKVLEQEVTSIVKGLRVHPSIIFWCGGNELFNDWSGMDEQSLTIRLMNKLCYENDRDRCFLMTSPIMGMGHGGYVFRDASHREVYEVFQQARMIAYTEFGVPSIAPVEQLRKIIPENEMFPICPTEVWKYHHAFEAWGDQRWACLDLIEDYFGEQSSIEDTVEKSQWLQCEGYKAAFEESRRQWPHCSMAVNWCYNEPWITAANNSLISYPQVKKPAYYTVKDSLRPTLATARITKFLWQDGEVFSFDIWYHNDNPAPVTDTVTAIVIIGGTEYNLLTWQTGEVAANLNKKGPTATMVLPKLPDAEFITVKLITTENDASNSYKLPYRCRKRVYPTRRTNV